MILNLSLDSSVNSAPVGFTAALKQVVSFFQNTFSDPITVNIAVGYGEVNGQALAPSALGESLTYLDNYSYTQIKSALTAKNPAVSLPANDPTGGHYWVATAEAKALGLSANSSAIDGYVGFSSGASFDYNNSNGVTAGQYDFFGVVAHEVSEVMGRQMLTGGTIGTISNGYEPMDLFHFASPGVRIFSGSQAGYFSANNGATNLNNFNTNAGGDYGDWAGSAGPDAFLAFGSSGVVMPVTQNDIQVMDVLGWNLPVGTLASQEVLTSAMEHVALAGSTTVATFTDTNTSDLASGFTASINWGDGITTTGTVSGSNGSFSVAGGHTYADEGSDPLSVSITRTSDNANTTANGTVTVGEHDALTPQGTTINTFTNQTQTNVVVATFSDSDTATAAGDLSASINWGDGTTTTGTVSGSAGSFTVTGSHTYTAPGTDNMQVTLSDDAPGTATATANSTAIVSNNGSPGKVVYDFNDDSKSDILWQNDSGQAQIWLMNGGAISSMGNVGVPDSTLHVIGAGDFNGDGKAEMLLQDDNGQASIWTVSGTSFVSGVPVGPNPGPTWHVKGAADFDGDGKAEILWQGDSGQTSIWMLNGTTFAQGFALTGDPIDPTWHDVGTGDFNGDGKADILRHNDNGQVQIWMMNGTTIQSAAVIGTPTSLDFKGTGDFNGDGKADIVWQGADGQVEVWLMNGTTVLSQTTIGSNPGISWHVKGVEDFNGDGQSDIILQNDNGQAEVWLMNGTSVTAIDPLTPNQGTTWHVIGTDFDTVGPSAPAGTLASQEVLTSAMEHVALAGSTTVATFTDTNPNELASGFTASINWGDSITTTGTVSGSNGSFSVAGGHTYADEGSDPVSVSITRTSDSVNTTANGQLTVGENDALTPHGTTINAATNQALNNVGVATFSDSDTVTAAGDLFASIDWGDGTTATGTVSGSAGSFTVTGSHTYTATGTDNVHVTLTDDAPGTVAATANSTAIVSNNAQPANVVYDFNGDGKSDILWQNDSGQAQIWLMNGGAVSSMADVGPNPGPPWHVIGAGDFNGDGKSEILWQNDSGQASIWTVSGTSFVSGAAVGPNPGTAWHVKGAADFDGDGKDEILWQGDSGQTSIWTLNGTTFAQGFALTGDPIDPTWHDVGTGDFNGDGKADILRQNDNGQVQIWLMNGTTIQTMAQIGSNPDPSLHAIGAGDLNGDGKADIVLQGDDGHVEVWFMNGTSVQSTAAIANPGTDWQVKGVEDFDGDGKADIVLQNAVTGQAQVWLMDGSTIHETDILSPNLGTTWHVDWA